MDTKDPEEHAAATMKLETVPLKRRYQSTRLQVS